MKRLVFNRKKKVVLITIALLAIALGVYLFLMLHVSKEDIQRSKAHIICRSYYALYINDRPALYFSKWHADSVFTDASASSDSLQRAEHVTTGAWLRRYTLLPSCNGRVVAEMPDTSSIFIPTSHQLDSLVKAAKKVYLKHADNMNHKYDELMYYLRVHNVSDEGYNLLAAMGNATRQSYHTAWHIRTILKSITDSSRLSVKHVYVFYVLETKGKNTVVRKPMRMLTQTSDHMLMLLQTIDKHTPGYARPLSLSFFKLKIGTHQYSLSSVRGLFAGKARNTGYTLRIPVDTTRVKLTSSWTKDSVATAVISDSDGTYKGQIDSKRRPSGEGVYQGTDGSYYCGFWEEGERNGFGFAFSANGKLRVGEWKNDRYQGERLTYSSQRIYGIDISKYQHIRGRHRYAIDWANLRISHLGSLSKKTVSGAVDFPISFVYIKSTEGRTLMNPYYHRDYNAARAHGFKVGTYHFFSVNSSATAQANFFVKCSHFAKGDFPPVLDVEPLPSQIRRIGGTGVLFSRIRTWLTLVGNHCGRKPVLYVSQTFVNRYLPLAPDLIKNYDIWIARYGDYKPDLRLVYWQLCPDGRVKGIHGEVDINVFNGYRNEYNAYLKNKTLP